MLAIDRPAGIAMQPTTVAGKSEKVRQRFRNGPSWRNAGIQQRKSYQTTPTISPSANAQNRAPAAMPGFKRSKDR
jgi:hypothetical protein